MSATPLTSPTSGKIWPVELGSLCTSPAGVGGGGGLGVSSEPLVDVGAGGAVVSSRASAAAAGATIADPATAAASIMAVNHRQCLLRMGAVLSEVRLGFDLEGRVLDADREVVTHTHLQ